MAIRNDTYYENNKNTSLEEKKESRADYFCYKEGEIEIGDTQCDFCKYKDPSDPTKCSKYPSGKPKFVIENQALCEYLENENAIL